MVVVLIALATVATASAQLPATPTEPSPMTTPAKARIVFNAGYGLRTLAADGSDMRQLTTRSDEGGDSNAAWSPNGESIAFVRSQLAADHEDAEDLRVHVIRADGTGTRPITAKASTVRWEHDPAWSPDGRQLAFVQVREGRTRVVASIIAVNLDDGQRRTVYSETYESSDEEGAPYLQTPAWSPNGETVLFTRSTFGGRDEEDYRPSVYAVPAAGGEARLLIRDAAHGAWSPDGGRIAYSGMHDRLGRSCREECIVAGEIYVASADGSNRVRLTESRADDDDPSWSGDGQRIVFASDRNAVQAETEEAGREIYSIRPDGSCLTWLTNGTADSYAPSVQPGTGLSGDPGGCGPSAREPLVETDMRAIDSPRPFRVWWLGAVAPNGLLVTDVQASKSSVEVAYSDCGRFDPDECGEFLLLMNDDLCFAGRILGGARPGGIETFHGALLYTERDTELSWSHVYAHRTRVEGITESGRAVPPAVLDHLRPVGGERAAGAPFPAARLPNRYWRLLTSVANAYRRTRSLSAVSRRLRLKRSEVKRRLAVGRRLAQLGVRRRLGC